MNNHNDHAAKQVSGTDAESILISLSEEGTGFDKLAELERKVLEQFQEEHYNLTIDLKNLPLAPTSMIVLLIKITSQARRLGGDLRLINLKRIARNNFITFSPNTYLSIEPSESYALYDFGENVALDNVTMNDQNENKSQSPAEEQTIEEGVKEKGQSEDAIEILSSLSLKDENKIRINSSADNLYQVCDFVVQRAKEAGFDQHELAKIKVTIYEASLNVVEHAYFSNPDYWIDVYAVKKDSKFYMVIHDWGQSFAFDPTVEYHVEEVVKKRKTGGFGIHIIKRSVDEVYYLADQKVGNRLILVKNIPKSMEQNNE